MVFYFIDKVTNPKSLESILPWIDQMSIKRNETVDPMGHVKALVGNKIDMPGRRVILQEDAEAFAYTHSLEYFETRYLYH
jgi:hypothetical protein